MPNFDAGAAFVVVSPSNGSQATKNAEQEMRKSFSDMLDDAGMDSFMNSIGNFMTDDEFFEMDQVDVFKEMYQDYQKTSNGVQKKETASKLYNSFSDLMAQNRNFTPKDLMNHFKRNDRLADVRKQQRLDEVDDEESKMTAAETSVGSCAQESTITDASAYQRGIKLMNLGANPLGVSVSTEAFVSDDGDDDSATDVRRATDGKHTVPSDNAFRQRRAQALNESKSKMNHVLETPRHRGRRGQVVAGDAPDTSRLSVRSSKIMMTPLKDSAQRPRSASRSRSRTPLRRAGVRDFSRSPSRSPGRGPVRDSTQTTTQSSPKQTPVRDRRTFDYYSSKSTYNQSPGKSPRKPQSRARSHSPGPSPQRSPRKQVRSHSPGPSTGSSQGERQRARSRSPTTSPRRPMKPQDLAQVENTDTPFLETPRRSTRSRKPNLEGLPQSTTEQSSMSPHKTVSSASEFLHQKDRSKLTNRRHKSPGRSEGKLDLQPSMDIADQPTKTLAAEDKSVELFEAPNSWENVPDSTVIASRPKVATKLQMRRRLQEAGDSSTHLAKCVKSEQAQNRSRSISRGRDGGTAAREHNQLRSKSPGRRMRPINRQMSVEDFRAGSSDRGRSPNRHVRGSRRYGSTDAATPNVDESASRHGKEESTRKSPLRQSRSSHRTASDSDFENSSTIHDDNQAGVNSQHAMATHSSTRTRHVTNRTASSDDVVPLSARIRARRPRELQGGSRHSVSSSGSASGMSTSQSVVSGTDDTKQRSEHQKRPPSRGRARPVGTGTKPDDAGRRRSRSSGPPVRRNRLDYSQSPGRERPREPSAQIRENKTPTRNRREPTTPATARRPMSKAEALASMRARKVAPATPQPTSKPAVGIARVKELNNRKTRSSSAPRPGRVETDDKPRSITRPKRESDNNRHSSFSGTLEELKRFRKGNGNANDDDNLSVDQSVQTWDPSNAPRRRTKPAPRRAPTKRIGT